VKARLLHVSDLHIRRLEPLPALDALQRLSARLEPTLVLATGDLAHRGRLVELQRAADYLRSLERPLLAVPGNHDIPYTTARFTRPFGLWTAVFGDAEPVYRDEGLLALGLNSARPHRHQEGALSDAQLARARADLEGAGSAFRIVALHHHVASPPWRAPNKAPVSRRELVLQVLAGAGADLVVSGHVHQATVATRREFEVVDDSAGTRVVLATVPGLGRPRPRRRGEAQGVNVYDVEAETLIVTTLAWNGEDFAEVARRTFPRA
jgi:3',5'-cyclic AMP phosphodiesterase CpdA